MIRQFFSPMSQPCHFILKGCLWNVKPAVVVVVTATTPPRKEVARDCEDSLIFCVILL